VSTSSVNKLSGIGTRTGCRSGARNGRRPLPLCSGSQTRAVLRGLAASLTGALHRRKLAMMIDDDISGDCRRRGTQRVPRRADFVDKVAPERVLVEAISEPQGR
jgi:hypothetical protein